MKVVASALQVNSKELIISVFRSRQACGNRFRPSYVFVASNSLTMIRIVGRTMGVLLSGRGVCLVFLCINWSRGMRRPSRSRPSRPG